MIKAGIIGGAGYTAGELLRLLINHPETEVAWIHSTSNAGAPVTDIHEGLIGDTDLVFSSDFDLSAVDVVFLCQGHGFSARFWEENTLPEGVKVIDLAQDFRDESEGYVYGLPEVAAEAIGNASKVANPGCFATAIQLALLPLAAAGKLNGEVHLTGITGSTGAGVKPSATTHFSWRNNNISVYKAFRHQHLKEIGRTLAKYSDRKEPVINFVPIRGDFPRGIFVTAYIDTPLSEQEARDIYADFYDGAPFTHFSEKPVDLKQVVNTNKCVVSVEKHGSKLLILAAIDNLLKGASGQAVQNMNLMFGLPEKTGLSLKPSAF
ncbi:MAG: N-acetyl-gamma-glutamyl-phosphate reductase [Duncaniella sp.]|nr:N-acetyl-gamma-glutamyl-phosphate reductase [Duncaniella sp.]MDE6764943.1 N-acetyl-gamma-glutamyl-phosphate reductase [Duncaniella sp.]